ncbi:BTAD domain-containing putative transcriptional regulator [Streptomyces sp. NPDC021354]|uniref:BTAD domain-containing putative transcriptional regulator n=1 Tax=Streptomyces sp. NPDC021354 TaxID=3154793 RepID=UPI0033C7B04B
MEFGLLGSVEAYAEGRPLDLGHARQRCVLAALLVDVGRPVTVEQLIDRVWAERPPRRARDTLYGYLSRLRQILTAAEDKSAEGVEIVRGSGGYLIGVAATAVDLHRFRDLVTRARACEQDDHTAVRFGQALALWRGDAFAGLDTPWINTLRLTLGRERLAAELDLDDVRLRLGRHSELVAAVSARAAAHPLDERVAGQFMLALYRCGRPAEALDHYQRTRQRLVEELGCDPGPALRTLHQRILAADPGLADPAGPHGPAPVPEVTVPEVPAPAAPGPRPGGRLVGRAAELAVIDRALEDTGADVPRVVEIVGEPGIGKTRLLGEFGERARRRGFTVLAGRGAEFTQAPYGVILDALEDHWAAADASGTPYGAPAPDAPGPLGAVFAARAPLRPAGAEPAAAGAQVTERHGFHRAVRASLEGLSSEAGLVLALDDLHWADEDSVELIGHLLRHPPRTRLLLALAYRPRQAPPRLPAALARAGVLDRVAGIRLGPLSAAEAAELCGPEMNRRRQRELYEASGGNPFYLEALARRRERVAAGPGAAPAVAEEPERSLSATLLEELKGVSAGARMSAQAAAVLGDSFETDLVAIVAEADEAHVLAAVDELAERDLIRQGGVPRRFAFRHPLVRAAVYHGAGVGWRIEAHARAARGLASRGAPLAARAPHVQQSARVGDVQAAEVLVEAADDILAVAPLTAAGWIGNALRLLGERPDRPRPEWLLKQADALSVAGHLRESRDILRTAASLLPAEARDLSAQVAGSRATVEWQLGRYQQAISLLTRELRNADGRSRRVTAGLELGVAAVALRTADITTAVDWGERALRTLAEDGAPIRVTTARGMLALAHTAAGDTARADHHLAEALAAIDDTGDHQLAEHVHILAVIGWTEMFRGRHTSALRHLDRGLELSRGTGRTALLADLFAARAYVLLDLGRLDAAAADAEDALDAAALTGSREPRSLADVVGAAVSLWRGDFAGALKICEESLSQDETEPGFNRAAITGMLGRALLAGGDPDGCVRSVTEAGDGPELLRFESPARPLWFRVLTTAELARGDAPAAERWARRAAAVVAPDGPAGERGFALLAEAQVRLAGDDAGAARAALEAAASFGAARMPLYEAEARVTAGTALAALARRDEALSEYGRAKELSSACGASALFGLADDAYRRTAAQVGPHAPRGQSPA